MPASQDRYRDKNFVNHTKIQECAGKILEHKNAGNEGYPKGYQPSTLRAAINLLVFEGLLSRRNDMILNDKGRCHIQKNGFVVYKRR